MKKIIIILVQFSLIACNWVNYSLGQVAREIFTSSRNIVSGKTHQQLWEDMGNLSIANQKAFSNDKRIDLLNSKKLPSINSYASRLFNAMLLLGDRSKMYQNLNESTNWESKKINFSSNKEPEKCWFSSVLYHDKVAINNGTNLHLDLTNKSGNGFYIDFNKFYPNSKNVQTMKTITMVLRYKHFF